MVSGHPQGPGLRWRKSTPTLIDVQTAPTSISRAPYPAGRRSACAGLKSCTSTISASLELDSGEDELELLLELDEELDEDEDWLELDDELLL